MKALTTVSFSMMLFVAAGVANHASAQENSPAQVREELILADQSGLDQAADASYRTDNPNLAQQGEHSAKGDSGMGDAMTGKSAAGMKAPAKPAACTGPVSYCNIFFGS